MPSFILRTGRETTRYVEWSTVVDNWVRSWNDRPSAEAKGVDPERLDRADEWGTSAMVDNEAGEGPEGRWYSYDDSGFVVHNQSGLDYSAGSYWLDRADLEAFVVANIAYDVPAANALLRHVPYED